MLYDYSEIGEFVNRKILEAVFVKDLLHVTPAKLWFILKYYVEDEKELRGYDEFGLSFKYIAKLGLDCWYESETDPNTKEKGLIIFHSSRDRTRSQSIHFDELKVEQEKLTNELKKYRWRPSE